MVLVGLTVLTGTTKISPKLELGIVCCHRLFFFFEGILLSHKCLLLISDIIAKLVQQLLKMKT